jgi:uncharacterized protein YneF (UPF0154 family)
MNELQWVWLVVVLSINTGVTVGIFIACGGFKKHYKGDK